MPESTPVGSVLVQVRAKDHDAGLNGNVRYKFSRHTAHEYATLFGIRPDNGKVFLQRGEAFSVKLSKTFYDIHISQAWHMVLPF